MSLLSDQQRTQIAERLADLVHPIALVLYVQSLDCDTCDETRRLLEDVASISPLIRFEEKNLVLDREAAEAHRVTRAPAVVLLGEEDGAPVDYGIRFEGAPVGYEFAAFLDAMLTVSRREPDLAEESLARLATLTAPVHFQVFSTPT
jgi:alkyl hydroperoxide reductase subunit AhpF